MSIVDPDIAGGAASPGDAGHALEGAAAYCPHCSAPVGDGVFPWPPDPTRCPSCGQWIGRNRAASQPVEAGAAAPPPAAEAEHDDHAAGRRTSRAMSFLRGRRPDGNGEQQPSAPEGEAAGDGDGASQDMWAPDTFEFEAPADSGRVEEPVAEEEPSAAAQDGAPAGEEPSLAHEPAAAHDEPPAAHDEPAAAHDEPAAPGDDVPPPAMDAPLERPIAPPPRPETRHSAAEARAGRRRRRGGLAGRMREIGTRVRSELLPDAKADGAPATTGQTPSAADREEPTAIHAAPPVPEDREPDARAGWDGPVEAPVAPEQDAYAERDDAELEDEPAAAETFDAGDEPVASEPETFDEPEPFDAPEAELAEPPPEPFDAPEAELAEPPPEASEVDEAEAGFAEAEPEAFIAADAAPSPDAIAGDDHDHDHDEPGAFAPEAHDEPAEAEPEDAVAAAYEEPAGADYEPSVAEDDLEPAPTGELAEPEPHDADEDGPPAEARTEGAADLRTVAAHLAVARLATSADAKSSRLSSLPIPQKLSTPRIARPKTRPSSAPRRPAPKPSPITEGAKRKRERQPMKITGIAMVAIGVLILAYGTVTLVWQDPWTAWQTARAQKRAKVQYNKIVKDFRKSAATQTKVATRDWLHRQAALFNLNTPEGQPVGKLSIPKIGIHFTIVQGTDEPTLQKGPAHYVETPLPGAKGKWTVGIAGHRTTYLAPFRHIDQLDPGDKVYISMPYARFYYSVEKTKIVDAADQTALAADGNITGRKGYNRLALTACHPPFSAAQRIIVYAKLLHYKVNRAPA